MSGGSGGMRLPRPVVGGMGGVSGVPPPAASIVSPIATSGPSSAASSGAASRGGAGMPARDARDSAPEDSASKSARPGDNPGEEELEGVPVGETADPGAPEARHQLAHAYTVWFMRRARGIRGDEYDKGELRLRCSCWCCTSIFAA